MGNRNTERRKKLRRDHSDRLRKSLFLIDLQIKGLKLAVLTLEQDIHLPPPPAPPRYDPTYISRQGFLAMRVGAGDAAPNEIVSLPKAEFCNLASPVHTYFESARARTHIAWTPEGLAYVQEPCKLHMYFSSQSVSSKVTDDSDLYRAISTPVPCDDFDWNDGSPGFSLSLDNGITGPRREEQDSCRIAENSEQKDANADCDGADRPVIGSFDSQLEIEMKLGEFYGRSNPLGLFHARCLNFLRKYTPDGGNEPITKAIRDEFQHALETSGLMNDSSIPALDTVAELAEQHEGKHLCMEVFNMMIFSIFQALSTKLFERDSSRSAKVENKCLPAILEDTIGIASDLGRMSQDIERKRPATNNIDLLSWGSSCNCSRCLQAGLYKDLGIHAKPQPTTFCAHCLVSILHSAPTPTHEGKLFCNASCQWEYIKTGLRRKTTFGTTSTPPEECDHH